MFDEKIFAQRLATARTALHLSQRQLAFRIGVSPRAVGQFEQTSSVPSVPTLVALADVLDCSLDWLTGRTDHR